MAEVGEGTPASRHLNRAQRRSHCLRGETRVLNVDIDLDGRPGAAQGPNLGQGVSVSKRIDAVEFRLRAPVKEVAMVEHRVNSGGRVLARHLAHIHSANAEYRIGD